MQIHIDTIYMVEKNYENVWAYKWAQIPACIFECAVLEKESINVFWCADTGHLLIASGLFRDYVCTELEISIHFSLS